MTLETATPPKPSTYDNANDLQDAVTGVLYQNISSDGEALPSDRHWFEKYLDIRPTADAPKTSMKLPQLLILIARFMVGANTANMSASTNISEPWNSALAWGIVNPGIIFGTEIYKNITRYWADSVNFWTNEGAGNPGWGLLTFTTKTLAASVPSLLIGFGLGAILAYYGVTFANPLARIVAALISPWIFVGTKKIIDYYFPSPEYQFSATPPLHPAQLAAMLAFNIMDAVNIYEFTRILIQAYGPKEILHNPHFALGVIPLYLLLSNFVDPYVFGRSPLYGAPPFEVRITKEEMGDEPLPTDDLHVDAAAAAEHAEARNDKIKNGVVYAACATLAFGAGLAADALLSRKLGDTTAISTGARKLGVGLTCAAAAVTQVATANAAPWVINTTKNCWASLFNNNTEHNERPAPPSFSPRAPATV